MGGYAGGKQASEIAAEQMMEIAAGGDLLDTQALLCAASKANQAVSRLQERSHGKMKTTMVFLALEEGKARWMHVGDSRLYHFRRGALQSQTMDHSVSQMAVLMGEITVQQIRFHEDRNRILRALGGPSATAELSEELTLVPGDAFLICTDGFWEYVYEQEMENALRESGDPAKWLARMEQLLMARVPEHSDNYTAAAVICAGAP